MPLVLHSISEDVFFAGEGSSGHFSSLGRFEGRELTNSTGEKTVLVSATLVLQGLESHSLVQSSVNMHLLTKQKGGKAKPLLI